ncbi:hypothetical protein F4821DRAFT_249470 [Hypoxylon rubiginosum]|uniref:Uncharacterized protein n=1 Tax=Hypoxylon rubiginosum TaxID=110542 RepID=A0ACC0CM34_9PEZI|nr:hypothetical protein F4821DRAFT_249470 [Hypoxylon rubiginosum]
MSWDYYQQRPGVIHEKTGNSSVAQMNQQMNQYDGPETQFPKNATESDISSLSTRSNSPNSELFDRSTTAGSVASPATVNTWLPISELQIAEQSSDGIDQFGSEHSCPLEFTILNPGNSLGSSLPDATDAAPRQQQIARHPTKNDAHGNQINDPDLLRKRTIDNGRSEETDSDIDDDDLDSDIEELHDDEWSGEPDRIETAVLANVEDLEFAAWLIIQLHRDQAQRKAQKIGGWQKGVVSCQGSSGSGESQRQASISSSGDQRSSNPRKRKRTSESDDRFSDDGDGEERDDGEGNGSPVNQDDDLTSGNVTRKYACPFNKLDPNRFGSNTTPNNEFRVCESGSKNIQRLKEHIKRKHSIIQCERCCRIFSDRGKKKEDSIAELAKHRREREPCALRDSEEASLGINQDQESLLTEARGKKRQKFSDVDKWFNIWDICFPGRDRPSHPWVEVVVKVNAQRPASDNAQEYYHLVDMTLQHHIDSGHIQFMPGREVEMMGRLATMVQSLYRIHVDRNGEPSLVNTSSGGQTETQTIMPATPLIGNQIMNISHQQARDPKINEPSRRTRPMPNRNPSGTRMDLDSFDMLPPQSAVNLAYAQQSQQFPMYGNQVPRVSSTHMPGPPTTLGLEQTGFEWRLDALNNNWPDFQYPLQVDTEDPEMAYMLSRGQPCDGET